MDRRSGPGRLATASAIVVLAIGALSAVASAHAVLVASSPGNDETVEIAPDEVLLDFDDPVKPAGDDPVVVIDPDGQQVQVGEAEFTNDDQTVRQAVGSEAAATDGTHTVSYRLLSADGHVVAGSYVFHVGSITGTVAAEVSGDPGTTIVGWVGRVLAYAGSLWAVGILAVAALVDRSRPALRPWALAGALALAGSLLDLWALGAEFAGGGVLEGFGQVPTAVESFGLAAGPPLWVLLSAGFLVAVALAGLCFRRSSPLPAIGGAAAGSAAVALAIMPALAGHASVLSGGAVLADAGHLLAAGIWVGGLAAMLLAEGDRDRWLRFSRVAVVAVAVVVLTGVAGAWWQLDDLAEMVTSAWGRVLSVKLVAVAVVVGLGAWHLRRLRSHGRGLSPRMLVLEVAAALAVVGIAAVLVDTPPPSAQRSEQGSVFVRQAGEVTVRMRVVPSESGPNEMLLYFLDLGGSLTPVDAAEIRVGSDEVQPRRIQLTPVTPSHFVATEVDLQPGVWNVEVSVVADGSTGTTTFEVPIE